MLDGFLVLLVLLVFLVLLLSILSLLISLLVVGVVDVVVVVEGPLQPSSLAKTLTLTLSDECLVRVRG